MGTSQSHSCAGTLLRSSVNPFSRDNGGAFRQNLVTCKDVFGLKLGGPFAVPVTASLAPSARLSEIRSAATRPRQRFCLVSWQHYSTRAGVCQARQAPFRLERARRVGFCPHWLAKVSV